MAGYHSFNSQGSLFSVRPHCLTSISVDPEFRRDRDLYYQMYAFSPSIDLSCHMQGLYEGLIAPSVPQQNAPIPASSRKPPCGDVGRIGEDMQVYNGVAVPRRRGAFPGQRRRLLRRPFLRTQVGINELARLLSVSAPV